MIWVVVDESISSDHAKVFGPFETEEKAQAWAVEHEDEAGIGLYVKRVQNLEDWLYSN